MPIKSNPLPPSMRLAQGQLAPLTGPVYPPPHVNILQPDLKARNPEDPFQAQRSASPSFYTGNISECLWDVQPSWIPVGEPCNSSGVTRKVAILKILFLPRLAAPVWRVSLVFPLEPGSVHTSTPWLPQRWLRRC